MLKSRPHLERSGSGQLTRDTLRLEYMEHGAERRLILVRGGLLRRSVSKCERQRQCECERERERERVRKLRFLGRIVCGETSAWRSRRPRTSLDLTTIWVWRQYGFRRVASAPGHAHAGLQSKGLHLLLTNRTTSHVASASLATNPHVTRRRGFSSQKPPQRRPVKQTSRALQSTSFHSGLCTMPLTYGYVPPVATSLLTAPGRGQ
jgi:hypothetical protein